jgi:Na+-driven multidrug efflux pump
MLLQTIGEAKKASILALARQGLFFLPLIIILPRVFGLLGIQISQPIADIFTFILTIPMVTSVLDSLKKLQQEENKPTPEEA